MGAIRTQSDNDPRGQEAALMKRPSGPTLSGTLHYTTKGGTQAFGAASLPAFPAAFTFPEVL